MRKQNFDWEVQNARDTLLRAEGIRKDKGMMSRIKKANLEEAKVLKTPKGGTPPRPPKPRKGKS